MHGKGMRNPFSVFKLQPVLWVGLLGIGLFLPFASARSSRGGAPLGWLGPMTRQTPPQLPQSFSQLKKEQIQATAVPSGSINILVNDPTGQDCFFTGGCLQSETTIATNGGQILYAGWNDSEGFVNPAVGLSGFGVSTDGGQTWTDGGGLPQGNGFVAGDPALAVCSNPNRAFYASLYVPNNNSSFDISVHIGSRTGNTVNWNLPINVTNTPDVFEDKEYLVCDRTNNNLYMSYTAFGFNGRIEFRRSTDGGLSWSSPVVLQQEEDLVNQGSAITTGPLGEVCVAWERGWFSLPTPEIRMRCSTDQGKTFGPSVVVAAFTSNAFLFFGPVGYNRGVILESPSLDFDKSNGAKKGTLYVAWQDAASGFYDIVFTTCTLAGNVPQCGLPKVVNDSVDNNTDDFFPWVSVAPNGKAAIAWYSNTGGLTDVYLDALTNSTPGIDLRVTDVSSDWLATAWDAIPNFGDYINLTSSSANPAAFHVLWADGRRGDPDVFYATVRPTEVQSITGSANRVGEPTDSGQVAISGNFLASENINLASATVTIDQVLNEASDIGELVRGAGGAPLLPLTLQARRGGNATGAIFETPTGVRPSFRIELRRRNPSRAQYEFTLRVDRTTIPEVPRGCPAGATLGTSFTLMDGVKSVTVPTTRIWRCSRGQLRTP